PGPPSGGTACPDTTTPIRRHGEPLPRARRVVVRCVARRSDGLTGATPRRQLVLQSEGGVIGRIHARQHGQVVLDLAPDAAHGDAEHALAALDQIEDVLRGGALVHRGTVAHEGDAREVVDPALAQAPTATRICWRETP